MRAILVCCGLAGCVTAEPIATPEESRSAWVQNNTEDPELTELASSVLTQQLERNGIRRSSFDLVAKLDAPPEGGLQIQVLCSSRDDHLLKAHVQVKAHGAPPQRLIPSMMAKAARDLAVDCR